MENPTSHLQFYFQEKGNKQKSFKFFDENFCSQVSQSDFIQILDEKAKNEALQDDNFKSLLKLLSEDQGPKRYFFIFEMPQFNQRNRKKSLLIYAKEENIERNSSAKKKSAQKKFSIDLVASQKKDDAYFDYALLKEYNSWPEKMRIPAMDLLIKMFTFSFEEGPEANVHVIFFFRRFFICSRSWGKLSEKCFSPKSKRKTLLASLRSRLKY